MIKHDIDFHPKIDAVSYSLVKDFAKIGMGVAYITKEFAETEIANGELFEIPIKENYNSTTEQADIIAMGMDYPNRLRIKTDRRVCINGEWMERKDLYHTGDRVYVFTIPPETHDPLCKNADYEVEIEPELGVSINQLDILLLRLSGKKYKG